MQITLNITEDSKVELVKDSCELVQGECCFTDFVFNFPATIKGYAIGEYAKFIEFAECKELGECVKFVDEIIGDKYELDETCTAFKKIMVQIVLERNAGGKKITWKTIPFTLEFTESINANGTTAIQTQLLSLADIKNSWEAFVKSNCFRVVYSADDVPFANAETVNEAIFYLGENTELKYGHYYRCTGVTVGGVINYEWRDITRDNSIVGVASGIMEINKSNVIQLWVEDQKGEFKALSTKAPNTLYLYEDDDDINAKTINGLNIQMSGEDVLFFAYGSQAYTIPIRKSTGWAGNVEVTGESVVSTISFSFQVGCVYEIEYMYGDETVSRYAKIKYNSAGSFLLCDNLLITPNENELKLCVLNDTEHFKIKRIMELKEYE